MPISSCPVNRQGGIVGVRVKLGVVHEIALVAPLGTSAVLNPSVVWTAFRIPVDAGDCQGIGTALICRGRAIPTRVSSRHQKGLVRGLLVAGSFLVPAEYRQSQKNRPDGCPEST